MLIVIRADASHLVGSGHIMRCLVLADELKRKGHDVVFACQSLAGDLIDFIGKRGHAVVILTGAVTPVLNVQDGDYQGWLQRSPLADAKDFLSQIPRADLVITDHYAIGAEWQRVVKTSLQCKIVAIDDLVRKHDADLILDQTLGRQSGEYPANAQVLAGSVFAVLAPKFALAREQALNSAAGGSPYKVLVSMGGVDAPNATQSVLAVLAQEPDIEITVLLSPKAPHYKMVSKWCESHANVTHHDFIEDMAALMLGHDIAIGAPGTTTWERACLGLPNVVIPLADNQANICQQLVCHHAAIKVEQVDIAINLLSAYHTLKAQWPQYRRANLAICDGLGTRRVVQAIECLFASSANILVLRAATEDDIQQVYQWQCAPETRKYALNPEIPTWHQHQQWMQNKLQRIEDYFYLLTLPDAEKAVGVVRLDRQSTAQYLVSIFIAPEHHGKGYAKQALSLIDDIHRHVTVHATVLKDNFASQRLFEKAGYTRLSDEEFVRYALD